MRFDILTLFCESVDNFLNESIIGRARKSGIIEVYCHQIRDFSNDKHHRVDDTPFGGGKGMLMQAQPIFDCYNALCDELSPKKPHLVYVTPQGETLTQKKVKELSKFDEIAILCGHYEGIDERVITALNPDEISLGDFVLTGGEIAALALVDSVSRMVSGVLSDEECFSNESHFDSLLECPQYTKPRDWNSLLVPEVLLNGDHAKIKEFNRHEALKRTKERRPDLLKKAELTDDDIKFLKSLDSE